MDCQEVLRRWLAGDGIRSIARATGLDRKTVRKYLAAALGLGLKPGDAWPEEKVIVAFVGATVHSRSAAPPGSTERVLIERRDQIQEWIGQRLLLTKVHELLLRECPVKGCETSLNSREIPRPEVIKPRLFIPFFAGKL